MVGPTIVIVVIILIFFIQIKIKLWDIPQEEIRTLKNDIELLNENHIHEIAACEERILDINRNHLEELNLLKKRLANSTSLQIQKNEFVDISATYYLKEMLSLCQNEYDFLEIPALMKSRFENKKAEDLIKAKFRLSIEESYKYEYLTYLYPELKKVFDGVNVIGPIEGSLEPLYIRSENLFEIVNILERDLEKTDELIYWKNRVSFLESANSNLTAIPYMTAIMADYETYGLEHLAKELDWGYAEARMKKVKSIREIRKDAKAMVEKNLEARYQLEYLLKLFPNLEDVLDFEFKQLPVIEVDELSEYDNSRNYLSKDEYSKLGDSERNQLALDRYKNSHNKTKWQIGRDYEYYIGYKCSLFGCKVDYFGSYMGYEDLGRDLIAEKDGITYIIQCKYWSSKKQIHENHVNQLYGTTVSYCIEHKIDKEKVKGILVTNITLSQMAKKMATYLGVDYIQNCETGDYPCIKCNIGKDENGLPTRIYHLPFDQQYDSTKIDGKGEFYALTVAEAEAAGFRRAYKWFGAK